jgi:hypothetical protein
MGPVLSEQIDKSLQVSPLMGVDRTHRSSASEPGGTLSVPRIHARALRPEPEGARCSPHPDGAGP